LNPPASARAPLAARLQLLGAAALFSTGGAAIKSTHLTGWQVACCRSAVAALALWLMLPAARRRPRPAVLLVSVAYAATMLLFVLANKLTTAASTIFLQATAPLYILLLAPWLLGERITRRDFAFMLAVAAGLGLLFADFGAGSATAPRPRLGNLLAGFSGLTWAFSLVGLRRLERRREGDRVSPSSGTAAIALVWGNLLAALFAFPVAVTSSWSSGGALLHDGSIVLYLGVFQIGLAYVALTRAIAEVPALEASLLLLLEPVLNPIWAWLIHGERPGALALAGGGVILLATLVKSWFDARPAVVPLPS
jgi:DME family drug/metabolite transporter